jgi:hypothetical protein
MKVWCHTFYGALAEAKIERGYFRKTDSCLLFVSRLANLAWFKLAPKPRSMVVEVCSCFLSFEVLFVIDLSLILVVALCSLG